jgi:hypothetical protein
MRSNVLALFCLLAIAPLFAHGENCSGVIFRDAAMPIYAPIARAAHVEGVVRFSIALSAELTPEIKQLDGPKLLEGAARLYIEGRRYSWKFQDEHSPCLYTAQIEYRIIRSESDDANNFYRVTVLGLGHTLVEVQPIKPTCSDCYNDTCPPDGIVSTGSPIYPMIARAAHVSGDISMTLIFNKSGAVTGFEQWNGPAMLRQPAEDYLRTWKNKPLPSYMNSCRASIMMEYRLTEATEVVESEVYVFHADATHILIEDHPVLMVDPATTKKKPKRFWLF